jgi:hypothetical protein
MQNAGLEALSRFAEARIVVIANEGLREALARTWFGFGLSNVCGVEWLTSPVASRTEVDLVVVAPDVWRWHEALEMERLFFDAQVPRVYYRVLRNKIITGPLVEPRHTSCLGCLAASISSVLADDLEDSGFSAFAGLEVSLGALALDAFRYLSGCTEPATFGRIHVHDLTTSESQLHRVLRMPTCTICTPAREASTRLWK